MTFNRKKVELFSVSLFSSKEHDLESEKGRTDTTESKLWRKSEITWYTGFADWIKDRRSQK